MIEQRKTQFILSAKAIDDISEICVEALAETETDKKDIIRLRLSLEEILGAWLEKSGEMKINLRTGSRFGKQYIELSAEGAEIDFDINESSAMLCSHLLAQAGLSLIYSYKNGRNCLAINPPKKNRVNSTALIFLAIIAAVVLGILTNLFFPAAKSAVLLFTAPLYKTILGIIRAVSSPLIFLVICCGIIGMGDVSTLGKVGKCVILRMMTASLIFAVLTVLMTIWFFPVEFGNASEQSGSISDIYKMLLDIVPKDIVSPFISGNTLQIIFMGAFVGAVMLVLGNRVSIVRDGILQLNDIVQYIMRLCVKTMPLFIFLCMFNMILSGMDSGVMSLVKILLLVVAVSFILAFGYLFVAALKQHANPFVVLKKVMPTFLIGFTTASSAAALSTNIETCEKKLGISPLIVNFGIPLGQVIYRSSNVTRFFVLSLGVAEIYNISVTPIWIITAAITTFLIAIASPPVPRGGAAMISVIFAQLGLPLESLAVALTLDTFMNFVSTSSKLVSLQANLIGSAAKLGMLDVKTLKEK